MFIEQTPWGRPPLPPHRSSRRRKRTMENDPGVGKGGGGGTGQSNEF